MLTWYYYDLKNKKNLIFKSKSRDIACKRIAKITHEPEYLIDMKLKSNLQLAVTMPFNIR
jgi:hypothetical protein